MTHNGITVNMTPEEQQAFLNLQNAQNKRLKIEFLEKAIASTDYMALKYFEGWLTDEEYAPIKAKRQSIRDQINLLESEVVPND